MHKMGNLIFDGKGIIGHDLIVKMKRSIEMLLQGFPPITVNGTAKEPITALTVYGHSTQSGTPRPENPVPILSAGSVMTTGKNVLPPEYGAEVYYNIPAGTKCFLVTDGTPSNGGNIYLYDAEGNVYYLAINAGDTEDVGSYGVAYNADIVRFVNKLVPGVNTAMYIGEKLPYEPYTGGVPGVNPYEGEINVSVSDGGTQSQTLTLSTPGGLPGIPVSSGGNYTDESGQQWICDEIDLARGKYVQRVGKTVVDGTEIKFTAISAGDYWNLPHQSAPGISEIQIATSKYFPINVILGNIEYSFLFTIPTLMSPYFSLVDELNAFCAEKYADGQPLEIYYIMAPIETDLPAEEIAAYKALHTYSPATTVSNDAAAWMKVGVIME